MKRIAVLLAVSLFVLGGCAGAGKRANTETHKFLEHAGIDWFNF